MTTVPIVHAGVGLVAIGLRLVTNPDRARVADQDSHIGNRDAALVNKNEVCCSKAQRFENDRAVAAGLNIHDTGIADQDGFESSYIAGPDTSSLYVAEWMRN